MGGLLAGDHISLVDHAILLPYTITHMRRYMYPCTMMLVLLLLQNTGLANYVGTNALQTEVGIWWGNEALQGSSVVSTARASVSAAYTNNNTFACTATAEATFNSVSFSFDVSPPLGYLSISQHHAYARAYFYDTFVICGPTGMGYLGYGEGQSATDSTVTVFLENDPTNTCEILASGESHFLLNGQESAARQVVFGEPFSISYDSSNAISIIGTNFNQTCHLLKQYTFFFDFTVCDSQSNALLPETYTILSSSGQVYPSGPPVFSSDPVSNTLAWHSMSGVAYQIECTTNLAGGEWQSEGDPIMGNGTTNHAAPSIRPNAGAYRLRMAP